MKRITSLMTFLLLFVCSAFAQEVDLETNAITIGNAVEEIQANKWYLLMQRRNADGYAHYESDMIRKRLASFADDPLTDGITGRAAENWLIRFIETEEEGIYKIQNANGLYWLNAGTSNQSRVNGVEEADDAALWAIYRINGDGVDGNNRPVFGICVGAKDGYRLDNDGNGGGLSIWGSGEITEIGGNNDWSIVDISFTETSAWQVAYNNLVTVFNSYSNYRETIIGGTGYGQYDVELTQAFYDALDAANPDSNEHQGDYFKNMSVEDLNALAQAIKDAYEAVIKTKKAYLITDITPGYYIIRNGLDFTETTTTEDREDEETGEIITGETITTHMKKAIYSDGTDLKWNNYDNTKASYIWKIDAKADTTGVYTLINCAKKMSANAINQGAQVTLTADERYVSFDYAGDLEKDALSETPVTYVNIRLSDTAERQYKYLHAGGHGGGANKEGNIVGWCTTYSNATAGATEWVLEAISEEDAQALLTGDEQKIQEMLDSVATIQAAYPGQKTIAEDRMTSLDKEHPVITDASQFSSPYSHNDKYPDSKDGQDLSSGCLIDGNASTYWHSDWKTENPAPNGVHYLQVSDIDAASYQGVAFEMVRRNNATNDHITKMSIYGYNEDDENLQKEDGILLATLTYPFKEKGETLSSDVFELQGCSVIRIYEEETTNNRGYWHAAEIQLYPATISSNAETTQAKARAEQIAAMDAALTAWGEGEFTTESNLAAVTEAFNALTAAWAAWTEVYVDPAALRAVNTELSDKTIVVGENPGQWKSNETLTTYNNLVAEVKAYDNNGAYTPAQSKKYINDLDAAKKAIYAAANPIETGVWYTFRFGTEEEYDNYEWDKVGASARIIEGAGNVEASPALFDKTLAVGHQYATVDSYTEEGKEEPTKYTIYEIGALEESDATFGANICFTDDNEIISGDASKFRFVAMGDSAYAIQNKMTGLYLKTGTTGATTLSVQPSVFTSEALGYGASLIHAKTLNGVNNNCLHGQRDGNILVTWNATTVASNSTLFIEKAKDVTEAPSDNFTMKVWPGALTIMTYPVHLTGTTGKFYDATINEDCDEVTLTALEGNISPVNRAVVYIADGEYEAPEEVEEGAEENPNDAKWVLETLSHANEFDHLTPIVEEGHMTGVYAQTSAPRKSVILTENEFATAKVATNVPANSGYFAVEGAAEITTTISGNTIDNIATVLNNANKTNDIYTIDGKKVGHGNVSTVVRMPKGIYVINGVKIVVK